METRFEGASCRRLSLRLTGGSGIE